MIFLLQSVVNSQVLHSIYLPRTATHSAQVLMGMTGVQYFGGNDPFFAISTTLHALFLGKSSELRGLRMPVQKWVRIFQHDSKATPIGFYENIDRKSALLQIWDSYKSLRDFTVGVSGFASLKMNNIFSFRENFSTLYLKTTWKISGF